MSKKILSVVLALVFVLSTFAVSAFAINGSYGEDENATYTQTWALDAKDNGDGKWTVDVKLTTDYAVGAIQFKVLNSNSNVTLDKDASKIGAGIPANYGAQFQCKAETGKVLIVPEPEIGAEAVVLTDAVIAELVYNVPTGESATLTIDGNDAKTEENPAGTLVALRMADEVLESGDMVYGQIVTKDADGIAAKAQLGSASAPELKGVNTGYVDTDRKYVYGVPAGDDANNYFTVENGSFEITGTFTGAVLTVKDGSGNAVATYTIIIFGDVNGDGAVTAADASTVQLASLGASITGDANVFAADVNGDGSVTAADASTVQLAALGGSITVNPYAA